MKIALITDLHFGVRNDSPVFLKNQERFYNEIFFPYIDKHKIKQIVNLGDTFDRRKYINFNTLHQVKSFFFDAVEMRGIPMDIIIGNHDVFHKNTNEVNSVEQVLAGYENISLIDAPLVRVYDGRNMVLCPWLNNDNNEAFLAAVKAAQADVMLGHLELNGFMMHKDTIACSNGLDRELFEQFKLVLSGHFHQPSTDGHVHYLGAPSEYTWNDYGSRRGFNVIDTETLEIEHIVNPYRMFERIFYDDNIDVKKFDYDALAGMFVRIIVGEKVDKKRFDKFMDNLDDADPHDVEVIDNSSYHLDDGKCVDEEALESEDTISIVESYVDSVDDEIALDGKRLKDMFRKFYVEALALEDV